MGYNGNGPGAGVHIRVHYCHTVVGGLTPSTLCLKSAVCRLCAILTWYIRPDDFGCLLFDGKTMSSLSPRFRCQQGGCRCSAWVPLDHTLGLSVVSIHDMVPTGPMDQCGYCTHPWYTHEAGPGTRTRGGCPHTHCGGFIRVQQSLCTLYTQETNLHRKRQPKIMRPLYYLACKVSATPQYYSAELSEVLNICAGLMTFYHCARHT